MKAPKGRTNMTTRRISCWLAPYQEEWLRARAAEAYPLTDSTRKIVNSPVSRYLRKLINEAMEADPPPEA